MNLRRAKKEYDKSNAIGVRKLAFYGILNANRDTLYKYIIGGDEKLKGKKIKRNGTNSRRDS